MKTTHFVEKSGYWVYDEKTKTIRHQTTYPYHNINQWVYTGGPGYIVVQDDKILDFHPSEIDLNKLTTLGCIHSAKEYIGFTDTFLYCERCGIKL